MSEVLDPPSQPPAAPAIKKAEPIGIRTLGQADPTTLSREQFDGSPDFFFHGAAKPFQFSPHLDYRSEEYLTANDGSTTLGFGFYAIDDRVEASNYSMVRQARPDATPIVVTILPHQARVLDLRDRETLSKNAPIPKELALKWRTRFRVYLTTKSPREGNVGAILDTTEREYAEYLDRVLTLDEIDLRVLLETAPCPSMGSRALPAPPWTLLFPQFMLEQGYDGLVYNEGGEGAQGRGGATYVFYNLHKIGTYESWHAVLD